MQGLHPDAAADETGEMDLTLARRVAHIVGEEWIGPLRSLGIITASDVRYLTTDDLMIRMNMTLIQSKKVITCAEWILAGQERDDDAPRASLDQDDKENTARPTAERQASLCFAWLGQWQCRRTKYPSGRAT